MLAVVECGVGCWVFVTPVVDVCSCDCSSLLRWISLIVVLVGGRLCMTLSLVLGAKLAACVLSWRWLCRR